jgi:hypothetical protein
LDRSYTILSRKLKRHGSQIPANQPNSNTSTSGEQSDQSHNILLPGQVEGTPDSGDEDDEDDLSDDCYNEMGKLGSTDTHTGPTTTAPSELHTMANILTSPGSPAKSPYQWDPKSPSWSWSMSDSELNFLFSPPLDDLAIEESEELGPLEVPNLDLMQGIISPVEEYFDCTYNQHEMGGIEDDITVTPPSESRVEFTITIAEPSIATIQSLTKIALENHASLRIERT